MRYPHCQAVCVAQIETLSAVHLKRHQTLEHFPPGHVSEKLIPTRCLRCFIAKTIKLRRLSLWSREGKAETRQALQTLSFVVTTVAAGPQPSPSAG